MAALDNGLDPLRQYYVAPDPKNPAKGYIYVGGHIQEQVPPGMYDFKKALIHSSNSYFITNGILTGIEKIVALGLRLHLGETTGLPTHQETGGTFPTSAIGCGANGCSGNTANVCIGQDPVLVTPLQMAVLAAAIANGGTVIYPRLIDRVYPSDPALSPDPIVYPSGRVRDHLGVSQRTMRILHEAMLADVEETGGTGAAARVAEMRICAKTGHRPGERSSRKTSYPQRLVYVFCALRTAEICRRRDDRRRQFRRRRLRAGRR